MGKGAGLESTGWGALGANDGVKYGATWTSYMPKDAAQMNADAPTRVVVKPAAAPKSAGDFDTIPDVDDAFATGGESVGAAAGKKPSSSCTIL